jgi:hypothetical protein
MGSLLSVIAVTVTANAPTALAGAAVRVRTERPPMVAVGAENDAVTLLGRPLTLRATGGPYRPVVARNEMLIRSGDHRIPGCNAADTDLKTCLRAGLRPRDRGQQLVQPLRQDLRERVTYARRRGDTGQPLVQGIIGGKVP